MTTQQQTSYNVLLIGDSCTDEYKIGTVDRLSPEAPVPVIKLIEEYSIPGMAANVKINLTNLGIDPYFITNNNQIIKTRFIDKRSGQHLLRVDNEPDSIAWSGNSLESLNNYDCIIISDYNKGFITYNNIHSITDNSSCPIFIDTKKTQLADINHSRVYFKINELEYKTAKSLPDNLIVTLGGQGALLKIKEDEMIFPTKSVPVVDVCGCGDTFLAALSAQYLFTKDIEKAIIFANIAAGITVQKQGNYAPTYDEIRRAGY